MDTNYQIFMKIIYYNLILDSVTKSVKGRKLLHIPTIIFLQRKLPRF